MATGRATGGEGTVSGSVVVPEVAGGTVVERLGEKEEGGGRGEGGPPLRCPKGRDVGEVVRVGERVKAGEEEEGGAVSAGRGEAWGAAAWDVARGEAWVGEAWVKVAWAVGGSAGTTARRPHAEWCVQPPRGWAW